MKCVSPIKNNLNPNKYIKAQRGAPKVLITGGAGFIGSNLARALLNTGAEVFVVDNLITGRLQNVLPLKKAKRFHFFEMDVTQDSFLKKFSKIPLNQIYHLACPTGVPNIKKLGEEMLLTCSIGTRNALELCRVHGAKFLVTSSSEIYGAADTPVQAESYEGRVNPVGVRSAYEEGKRFTEALVIHYVRKYRVDADIVRLFNTYGPGMSPVDQRVIPRFLRSLKNGRPLTIYGNGEQKRTFLFIDDLISALTLVMAKGGRGEVYNIGGPNPVTIKELAQLICNMVDGSPDIHFVPHFIEDHDYRKPLLTKIRRLGWRQTVLLRNGLRRMMEMDHFKPRGFVG